jgi:hypothetical protein
MRRVFFAGLLPLLVICFQSCEKSETTGNTDTVSLENNLKAAVTEIVSTSVNTTSLQDVRGMFMMPHISDCATVTASDSIYPKVITIDYGTGCDEHHHHSVSGKIIISISDSLNHIGANKTITSEGLYIDSAKVELNASITNLGLNADGNWIMLYISNQKVTLNDTTILTQMGTDTLTWVSGFETPDKSDDVYYKTGSGTISINDSLTYSRTITKALLYDRSCEYILSGTVELYKNGSTVVIDYGDGTCDQVATVTTDGTTEEINLPDHSFDKHGRFGKHCHGFGAKGQ